MPEVEQDGDATVIHVSSDKRGRRVVVEPVKNARLTLEISGSDTWTWLSPDEARQIAAALREAADASEWLVS